MNIEIMLAVAGGILIAAAVVAVIIAIVHFVNEKRLMRPSPFTHSNVAAIVRGEIWTHEQQHHGLHGGLSDQDADEMKRKLAASGKMDWQEQQK